MRDDLIIDKFLQEIYNAHNERLRLEHFHTLNRDRGDTRRILTLMLLRYDLIQKVPNNSVSFTKFGHEVMNEGGWIKYNEGQKKIEDRTKEQDHYEYKMARWQYYTFWPVLVFGLFGGIYSVYDIIDKSTSRKQNTETSVTKIDSTRVSSNNTPLKEVRK